ncbi:tail fiber domain-containing protein [Pasteurellaceae bacterium 20609_3]|uniref:tail fiber domain-containing protein n=1 Tax=Spirabiliibacterium mucosae TaxID=28156 RepID=UPI001AACB208|nr:tail fiber domain-containing protein [Spirabiliibacterium mucosae]MBE2898627.1 tail fiber domain-containing protein [Spirabiliibacterium mucosae]
MKTYRWKDAIEEKKGGARYHVGVIAQEVQQAFAEQGLNAGDYGAFCYDQWAEQPEVLDEEGNVIQSAQPAGDRYGVRMEELLALKLAYACDEIEKLKKQVAKLKG